MQRIHNVYIIASKEFSDLVRSNIIIVVLAVYLVLFLYSYFASLAVINNNLSQLGVAGPSSDPVSSSPGEFIMVLCGYGGLVAVVLGFSSMYNEVSNSALNTLAVKPVYRDMILNGKLLGAVFFACCLFVFTTMADISMNFIFWGEEFSKLFPGFLGELPLVLVCYLLVFMTFYLLTVLMFLLVRKNSLAFFLSFITWIFTYEVMQTEFALCLASFFPDSDNTSWVISSLSPRGMLTLIFSGTTTGTIDAVSAYYLEFFKLILYVGVLLVSCYTVFLKRDIA